MRKKTALDRAIRRCRHFLFRRFCLQKLLGFFCGGSGSVFLFFVLDNLLAFSGPVRQILLLCLILGGTGFLLHSLRIFSRSRRTDRECALILERFASVPDNAIVNAVCFRESEDLPPELKQCFLRNAETACSRAVYPSLRGDPHFRNLFRWTGGVLVLFLLYGIFFPRYLRNAAIRFARPNSQTASLNFIQFQVEPGNAAVPAGSSLMIRAAAVRDSRPVSRLNLHIRSGRTGMVYPMPNGTFLLTDIREDLTYHVSGDREESRSFRIRVLPPPVPKGFRLTARPPAYTGQPSTETDLLKKKDFSFPAGTVLNFSCISPGAFLITPAGKKTFPAEFRLERDNVFSLSMPGPEKVLFPQVWSGSFRAVPDRPPKVRFLNASAAMELLYGETAALTCLAEDDYGIASLELTGTAEKREFPIRKFTFPLPGKKRQKELFLFRLTPEMVSSSGILRLHLKAEDFGKNTFVSPDSIVIHVRSAESYLQERGTADEAGKCYESLRQVKQIQTQARNFLANVLRNVNRNHGNHIFQVQNEVFRLLDRANSYAEKSSLSPRFRKALKYLRDREARELIRLADRLRKQPSKTLANEIILKQTTLLSHVQDLLGNLALQLKKAEEKKREENRLTVEKELYEQMKNLQDNLEKFKAEQRKILTQTEHVDPKNPEDFSEGEEKLLGDLAAKEQEWSAFFKTAFSDLSKKHEQDFSNSAMADEFTEMYEELQKAGDALKDKKIEIATLAEDTALDSANAAAANIERWLSDKKDHIKWISEEDGKMQDTDLTDLPAELTDIIGELIEQEEDMTDDTSDSSNSFAYDSDEGLGWGTGDGTIDSMQAKGITGNVLPNNNEVGGRSGEGRSGKSAGQFVEKEATGKGGRKTPTRLVQSPFEKGTVKDTSSDPAGGATGGGKQSGVGGEGLAGITPDQDPRTGQRLPGLQGELRQKTQSVLKTLSDRNLPTGDIRDALARIGELEKIGQGSGVEARRIRSELLSSLRRARTAVEQSVSSGQEDLRVRSGKTYELRYNRSEKIPDAYSGVAGEYFKAIATEGENRK